MMGRYIVLILFAFLVDGVFGDTGEVMSVKEGDDVFLNTSRTKKTEDAMKWYFNYTLIALINGNATSSCSYYGDNGRFRDKLKMHYETGSLTIIDITIEHTGPYEAEHVKMNGPGKGKTKTWNKETSCDSTNIIRKQVIMGDIIKRFSLNVTAVQDSGQSTAAKTGICVAVAVLLLLV